MEETIWRPVEAFRTETIIGLPGSADALARAGDFGVTAVQTEVRWCEVEPEQNTWDWSAVEREVRDIRASGLLWVPGLHFTDAVPAWFEEKGLSLKQRCIEHGRENGPESIWNPHLRPNLRRFYEEFLGHFGGVLRDAVYEIELFAGQYGESNYFFIDRNGPAVPGWGGALHYGFQCGDELARRDFRQYLRGKYATAAVLNEAWGTGFAGWEGIEFVVPEAEAADPKDDFTKAFDDATNTYRFDRHVQARLELGRRWADQVEWYRQAMAGYYAFVIGTAREVFGDRRLVARLGGCSYLPWLGSDQADNVKTAAGHGVEIRFTGAVHPYDQKVISTACRFYRTPMWTEPMYAIGRRTGPTVVRPRRWYDAIYFGAACGQAVTREEYTSSFFSDDGSAVEGNIQVYRDVLDASLSGQPVVRAAVLLPTLQSRYGFDHRFFMGDFELLLDYADADLVGESLVSEGILDRYDVLFSLAGGLVEDEAIARIEAFVRSGGIFACGSHGLLRTLSDPEAGRSLLGLPGDITPGFAGAGTSSRLWRRQMGKGSVLVSLCDDEGTFFSRALEDVAGATGLAFPDGKRDSVFMAQFGGRVVLFNRNEKQAEVEIAGKRVEIGAYDERSKPLAVVPYAFTGPRIEQVDFAASREGFRVRVLATAPARGYLEIRRPDYRTLYADLVDDGRVLTGGIPVRENGRYLLSIYLLDERDRPVSQRRFEARIAAPAAHGTSMRGL